VINIPEYTFILCVLTYSIGLVLWDKIVSDRRAIHLSQLFYEVRQQGVKSVSALVLFSALHSILESQEYYIVVSCRRFPVNNIELWIVLTLTHKFISACYFVFQEALQNNLMPEDDWINQKRILFFQSGKWTTNVNFVIHRRSTKHLPTLCLL